MPSGTHSIKPTRMSNLQSIGRIFHYLFDLIRILSQFSQALGLFLYCGSIEVLSWQQTSVLVRVVYIHRLSLFILRFLAWRKKTRSAGRLNMDVFPWGIRFFPPVFILCDQAKGWIIYPLSKIHGLKSWKLNGGIIVVRSFPGLF